MLPRSIRSITAAGLVTLLGVLHTGLPTHSHEADAAPAAERQLVIDADHHAHGTMLVEQAERVQSAPVELGAPAMAIAAVAFFQPVLRVVEERGTSLRPCERGPPPAAPRAPPQLI